ncbi:MAG: aspartate kinase [Gammaproteobacteria bacterium]
MTILVQKFGGTSVATIERIRHVAKRIAEDKRQGNDIIVVVSAMNHETDKLIALAKEAQSIPASREIDMLLATGEQKSMSLLAMALIEEGCSAKSMTGWQAGIHTSPEFNTAKIIHIDKENIQDYLDQGVIVVVAGFQGIADNGEITTLGRGGSDLTAVALAGAFKASECQIFTDVDGVHTTDPNIVKKAPCLPCISFEEMLELSSMGAKVLHRRAVELAGKMHIPLRVLSSFKEGKGTLVTAETQQKKTTVTGIAYVRNICLLHVLGSSVNTHLSSLFTQFSIHQIVPAMTSHTLRADKQLDFHIAVTQESADKVKAMVLAWFDQHSEKYEITARDDLAQLSVIGTGVQSSPDASALLYSTLGDLKVDMLMVSHSESKLSVLIKSKELEPAIQRLHDAYALESLAF